MNPQLDRVSRDFAAGYNCAQAMLAAFGPELGLPREQCLALAAPFGAGMAREGEVCGALTGALLVLGLRYARAAINNPGAKEEAYRETADFLDVFRANHGTILCRGLLGVAMNTPEGLHQAREQGLHQKVCVPLVDEVARMLAEWGQ